MKIRKTASIFLATAVAVSFATVSLTAAAGHGKNKVQCSGINSCKGKSQCKGATNACKGMNTCKGKGVVFTKSAKDCENKGGTVVQ
jgi:hypothetical protein